MTVSPDQFSAALIFNPLCPSHSGEYSCVAVVAIQEAGIRLSNSLAANLSVLSAWKASVVGGENLASAEELVTILHPEIKSASAGGHPVQGCQTHSHRARAEAEGKLSSTNMNMISNQTRCIFFCNLFRFPHL
jgi:hypothetical protein